MSIRFWLILEGVLLLLLFFSSFPMSTLQHCLTISTHKCLMACCAFLFPRPLTLYCTTNTVYGCGNAKEKLVLLFISVFVSLFLFVLLSSVWYHFMCVVCVLSFYLEWRTSWASFTNSTQRTSAWNPVSFSILVFLFVLFSSLDCTIVISVGILVFFLSTRVQKLSKLIWVFLFVCFCVCVYLT